MKQVRKAAIRAKIQRFFHANKTKAVERMRSQEFSSSHHSAPLLHMFALRLARLLVQCTAVETDRDELL